MRYHHAGGQILHFVREQRLTAVDTDSLQTLRGRDPEKK